ncbi:hypothetical protein CHS0354_013894 [Potamilus streckersoni]|uniref:DDB1- and CUL4-associated factor 8 n=1 Tax=Potamilus streckersoni TaxID=2493646 RepID=A0AAE0RWU8_9BIVA|nr:hypothetical protein CHS0354_013894 [Potamilus streckersoni]
MSEQQRVPDKYSVTDKALVSTENQNHSPKILAQGALQEYSKCIMSGSNILDIESEHFERSMENQAEETVIQQNLNTDFKNKSEDQSITFESQSNHNNSNGEHYLTIGTMRKDDSGIDLEKSPTSTSTKDCSDLDGTESISESFEDSAVFSHNSESLVHGENVIDVNINEASLDEIEKTDKDKAISANTIENYFGKAYVTKDNPEISDSNDVEGFELRKSDYKSVFFDMETTITSPDAASPLLDNPNTSMIQMEEGEAAASRKTNKSKKSRADSDDSSVNSSKCLRKRRIESDSDDSDASDENIENIDAVNDSKHSLSLDSDDFSEEEEAENNSEDAEDDQKSKNSSSDNDEDMDISDGKVPKHNWKALADVREREYGYRNNTPPGYFRQKIQGSLRMVQRLKLQYKMEYHEGCVNALHFNRIGTLLASGSDDLNIVLWNWLKNRPALVYDSGHRSNVFQAKFMPFSGDCHVVSCARDGQIRLADLSLTGVCKGTKKLAQHKGAAHKLALELESPHIFLSCGEDAIAYEIDLRQEKPNKLVVTKENNKKVALYSIHSNPCNPFEFCVGGRDHFIRLYDKRKIAKNVDDGILKKFCPSHLVNSDLKANVTCACYNYNGTEVLGTYNDEDIYLFNNDHSDGADYIHKYIGHRNNQTVKGVNFYGPKSEFIVSGSDCAHIYLWDKETEKIVQLMEGDEGGVINVLEPHPFAPILATSGLDPDVKIWAPTAEDPTELKGMKKLVKHNKRQRDEERRAEPEMVDGQMLWFIMNQLRRSRRRRAQEAGLEDDEPSSSSEDSDSDSENSEGVPERLQCVPS